MSHTPKARILALMAATVMAVSFAALAAHAATPTAAGASTPAPASVAAPSRMPSNLKLRAERLPSGVIIDHFDLGPAANLGTRSPGPTSSVTVAYVGKLAATGAVFDASRDHGGTVSFNLNQVIPCFSEGLQRLRLNEVAVLHCPATTAYGEKGAGKTIPPNADLTFGVRLLAIN